MQIKKNPALRKLLINLLTGKQKLTVAFNPDAFNLESFSRALTIADEQVGDLSKLNITDLVVFFLQYIYANTKNNNKDIIGDIIKKCDRQLLALILTAIPLFSSLIIEKMPKDIAGLLKEMHNKFCDVIASEGLNMEKGFASDGSLNNFQRAYYYCYAYTLKLKKEQTDTIRAIKIFEKLSALGFKAATYQLLCLYDPYDTTWSDNMFRDINKFSQVYDKLNPLNGGKYYLSCFNAARMHRMGYEDKTGTVYKQELKQAAIYYLDLYVNLRVNVLPELLEIYSASLKIHSSVEEFHTHSSEISRLDNNNNNVEGKISPDFQLWLKEYASYRDFLTASQTAKVKYKNYEYCLEERVNDEMPRYIPLRFANKNAKQPVVLFGCPESIEVRCILPTNAKVNEKSAEIFCGALCYYHKNKSKKEHIDSFILIKYLEHVDKLNSHNPKMLEMNLPEKPQKKMNPCAPNFYPSSSFGL